MSFSMAIYQYKKKKGTITLYVYTRGSQLWPARYIFLQFSSSPNQTHLNKLIKVFRITRKLQAGEFDQGWS